METLEMTLRKSHDWAIDRIHTLCEDMSFDDAHAIQAEFSEWFDPDILDHDIFSMQYIGDDDAD